ncbi:MAG TPA: FAD-dependent oxidoreductase [Roseiflexaceae bacterium]|nr:FAD-dependent oxidoreductase [Roseiflexaceae bacterium]
MSTAEPTSFWQQSTERAPFPAPARLPAYADALVIGGGALGTAVCYWLARAGLRTVLLEQHGLGWGASGRNAGLMLAGAGPLEDPALLRQILAEEHLEVGYHQPGHLALASGPEIWSRICEEVARRAPQLPPLHALDRAACEDLLGTRIAPGFWGGRWLPSGGAVHPLRLIDGLATAAAARGAVIATETVVQSIAHAGADLHVATSRGVVRAGALVCACHSACADLLPELAPCFRPIRGQMLATEPLPPLFRMGMAVDWGTLYWRQAENGTVLLGGYRRLDPEAETGQHAALNPLIQTALERFLPEAFPEMPPVRVAQRWAGIMDETPDGRPLAGPAPLTSGCWVLAGFGGHGLPGALGFAHALAQAVVTGTIPPAIQPYNPARHTDAAASGGPCERKADNARRSDRARTRRADSAG